MRSCSILLLLLGALENGVVSAFLVRPTIEKAAWTSRTRRSHALQMAAESEVSFGSLDGTNIRVGIIKTRWNSPIVNPLVEGATSALAECNVTNENTFVTEVPGSFELPYAARLLALSGTVDVVLCVGVLLKGDTLHFEYIADAVSKGLMNVGLSTNIPCIFGVLTCLNEEQAKSRSSGTNNHGVDWGKTAVEMALLKNEAMGMKKNSDSAMGSLGFGTPLPVPEPGEKKKVGFF